MTKKVNFEEDFEELEVKKPKIVEPLKVEKGNPVKVLNIIGMEVVVMDGNKNGFRVPLTDKMKGIKIGDTIYL